MKIAIMTLGCKVNKYESDALINNLNLKGFETTDNLEFADVYVINTCAVTNEAEKKSRQMIARCKKYNKNAKFLKKHKDFKLTEINVDGINITNDDNMYTFYPNLTNTEGFFIGRLKRK